MSRGRQINKGADIIWRRKDNDGRLKSVSHSALFPKRVSATLLTGDGRGGVASFDANTVDSGLRDLLNRIFSPPLKRQIE